MALPYPVAVLRQGAGRQGWRTFRVMFYSMPNSSPPHRLLDSRGLFVDSCNILQGYCCVPDHQLWPTVIGAGVFVGLVCFDNPDFSSILKYYSRPLASYWSVLPMKIVRIVKSRSLFLAAAFSVSLGFTLPAFATSAVIVNPDGSVIELGTLGGLSSEPYGINDKGQVVGWGLTAEGARHAFITGPNGVGITDLGALGGDWSIAYGVNAVGQVTGSATTADGVSHGFITGPNGTGMSALDTLPDRNYVGQSINDAGQVAGYSLGTVYDSYRGFMTGPNGVGITDLDIRSATGINNAGQVTGFVLTSSSFRAIITGPNGVGVTEIGTFGGPYPDSIADGINDAGRVVGSSTTADGGFHGYITGPDGAGMTDLGALRGGQISPTDVNDAGQVVGMEYANESAHGFVTGPDGTGMVDLNSFAKLSSDDVFLSRANGINNLGQIIAVVSPIPEPASYALMLAGLGLVGLMVRRKKSNGNC